MDLSSAVRRTGGKGANVFAIAWWCLVMLVLGASVSRAASTPAPSGERGPLASCTMTFNLHGWSVFYKTAWGSGTIRCSNGEHARVKITAKGGGITFGKSDVLGGTGKFTGARNITELFGAYAQSEAHAGVGKSGDVQALTKGTISLALSGTGRGIDIGFDFGKFTIRRVK